MPETRFLKEFKNGVLVNSIPYEVSQNELDEEKLQDEFNAKHVAWIAALDNWGTQPTPEKWAIMKDVLRWVLWQQGYQTPE